MSQFILSVGPMFSQKTTNLISDLEKSKYKFKDNKYIIFKINFDKRYSIKSEITTHSGLNKKCVIISDTKEILKKSENYNLIGIDEIQFFENIDKIIQLLLNEGKTIYATGLSSDSNMNSFPIMNKLYSLATSVIFRHAICVKCKSEASYTKKKIENDKLIEIGGDELYNPVCWKCYWN